jgi:hypothetical protein
MPIDNRTERLFVERGQVMIRELLKAADVAPAGNVLRDIKSYSPRDGRDRDQSIGRGRIVMAAKTLIGRRKTCNCCRRLEANANRMRGVVSARYCDGWDVDSHAAGKSAFPGKVGGTQSSVRAGATARVRRGFFPVRQWTIRRPPAYYVRTALLPRFSAIYSRAARYRPGPPVTCWPARPRAGVHPLTSALSIFTRGFPCSRRGLPVSGGGPAPGAGRACGSRG